MNADRPQTLRAALAYAARGHPVFPCGADKRPLTQHGFKDATTDEVRIRAWWAEHPSALIGMPTGDASGLWVLDVDNKNGVDGAETLYQLERAHGELPGTVQALTPTGGQHIYFALPNDGEIRNSAGKLGPGLDVRGSGGYVILPPSRANGRGYEWEASCDPDEGAMLARAPEWLCDLARSDAIETKPANEERELQQGKRNTTLFSLACSMRAKGLTQDGILAALRAENAARCDSPLSEVEVRAIAASAARYEPGTAPALEAPFRLDLGDIPEDLEASLLPPRPWVVKDRLLQGYVSVSAGPAGVGKSAFEIASAVSVCTGISYTGEDIRQSGRAWIYCNEEDRPELLRRYVAFCRLHGIDPRSLRGSLRLSSGYGGRALVIARRGEAPGSVVPTPVVDELIEELTRWECLSFSADPIVSTHRVTENSNEELEEVMDLWREVAFKTGCAIQIPSHVPKWADGPEAHAGNLAAIRGASSIGGAARFVVTLARMGDETAKKYGIDEEAQRHMVRLDLAKGNYSPPAEKATWLRMRAVCLDNDPEYPDWVGAFDPYPHEMQQVTGARDGAKEEALSGLRVAVQLLDLRQGQKVGLTDVVDDLMSLTGKSRAWIQENIVHAFPKDGTAAGNKSEFTWSKEQGRTGRRYLHRALP
ncbi:MAG: bifunctional DNA primase/polymerase [Pseudomonadota bacterium]|nr:bifunctional DNA primase/polymerase [Pseudomonadota bacterium]